MKLTQVNDTTIRITITLDDLADHGMEMMDFVTPQEKTEDFFYTILQELDLPEGFGESGMMSFRVTPKPDRVEVYVTQTDIEGAMDDMEGFADLTKALTDPDHVTPDEALTMLEEMLKNSGASDDDMADLKHLRQEVADHQKEVAQDSPEETDQLPEFVHYVLGFDSIEAVVTFAKQINLPIEGSELYKLDKHHYYLTVLLNTINQPREYANQAHALLLEYAQDAGYTRAYLLEHAHLLLADHALEFLVKLKVA